MTQTTSPHRPLAGLLVGAAMLTVVAVPAFWTGIFALASFSGCFISCGEPDPRTGVYWGGATLLLLSVPVLAGIGAARSRLPWTAVATLVMALLALGWTASRQFL